MKFLGMAVKAAISLALAIYLLSDGILMAIAWFGIAYGLLSYYVWYFKKKKFSFSAWIGSNGLLMTLLSLLFGLLAPLIPLVLIILLFNSILPGSIGETVGSLIVLIIYLGFAARDVVTIIQHFNPSFSVPFLDKKDGNGDLG